MLDLVFTYPYAWGLVAVGVIFTVLGGLMNRKRAGDKKVKIKPASLPLLLLGGVLVCAPFVNPMFLHLGQATKVTDIGGDSERIWAVDYLYSSGGEDSDPSYHYRFFVLDGKTGERRARFSVGQNAYVVGSEKNKVVLRGPDWTFMNVDVNQAAVASERSLDEVLAANGITAPVRKVDFGAPGSIKVHTKDDEHHVVKIVDNARKFERDKTLIQLGGKRLAIQNNRIKHDGQEDKYIKGQFVITQEGAGPLAIIRHYDSTDRIRWRLTAVKAGGAPLWTVNEEDLRLNKSASNPLLRIDDDGERLLVVDNGVLSVLDLATGKAAFTVQM